MVEKVLSVTYDSTDFISAQQRKPITENQTLSYRLSRAPLSLAKCAIISKASRSKQLSASETKFLNRWRKSVLNEDPSVFLLSKRFDMALRDLSDSDKATLSKLGFNITATFDNMSVRDLIFELSETFNQSLIPEFEKQFAAESMYSTWHVNPEHVHRAELYVSNKRKLLLDRMEDFQWYNAGKFKQEDIDNIVEMFSIGRNKHARDAVYWDTDKQSLLDFIGEINDHDNRWELLGLIRKSQEMLNRGLHAIEPLIQSDKQLNKFVAKRLDEERDKLINAVFAKTYSGLTEDDIQHFCSNIIQRMYLLKKFFPPKLAHTIGVVVTHPNASAIDIQNLTASLEMFKINLRDFSKRDLLFKDPVRATTPANPLLGGISSMNDPAVISRQFEAANYDIGRVMADGLRSTLS